MTSTSSCFMELRSILLQWIFETIMEQGMDEKTAKQVGDMRFTFGSYTPSVPRQGRDMAGEILGETQGHLL